MRTTATAIDDHRLADAVDSITFEQETELDGHILAAFLRLSQADVGADLAERFAELVEVCRETDKELREDEAGE